MIKIYSVMRKKRFKCLTKIYDFFASNLNINYTKLIADKAKKENKKSSQYRFINYIFDFSIKKYFYFL